MKNVIDGVEIKIDEEDDKGDLLRANQISAGRANANDTLMVVGHMSSTRTKEGLVNYLRATPPIPVILTTETNPFLVPPDIRKNEYRPLFRLSPTDDEQAEHAAEYAISKGATTFWVVEDATNPVYANYLALGFIEGVQQKRKVLLWSTNLVPPAVDTFRALGINCVFFAGQWSNALILIRQIKAISQKAQMPMPMIILSDSSADSRLIEQGGKGIEQVYLTHPLKASQYNDNSQGYRLYGEDACSIVEELIKRAQKRFGEIRREQGAVCYWLKRLLNIHRVGDARSVITEIMQDAAKEGDPFPSKLDSEHRFDIHGKRAGARFHIWQVRDGRFTDVD